MNEDLHCFSKMKELKKYDNFKIEDKGVSVLFDSVILEIDDLLIEKERLEQSL